MFNIYLKLTSQIQKLTDKIFVIFQNIQTLSFKQRYSKFLEEVQQNKYQQFIKNDSKTEEVLAVEQAKNSDLMNAVENLKNDYPLLDKQFTRLSNELFQATQLLFNESDE